MKEGDWIKVTMTDQKGVILNVEPIAENDVPAVLKKIRFQSIFASVLFLVMSLLINILFAFLSHQRLSFAEVNFLGWLTGSVLFGIASYYYAKSKITIEK